MSPKPFDHLAVGLPLNVGHVAPITRDPVDPLTPAMRAHLRANAEELHPAFPPKPEASAISFMSNGSQPLSPGLDPRLLGAWRFEQCNHWNAWFAFGLSADGLIDVRGVRCQPQAATGTDGVWTGTIAGLNLAGAGEIDFTVTWGEPGFLQKTGFYRGTIAPNGAFTGTTMDPEHAELGTFNWTGIRLTNGSPAIPRQPAAQQPLIAVNATPAANVSNGYSVSVGGSGFTPEGQVVVQFRADSTDHPTPSGQETWAIFDTVIADATLGTIATKSQGLVKPLGTTYYFRAIDRATGRTSLVSGF